MRIVAALGGNALLRRGEAMTEGNQRANVHRAAAALAPLCTDKNEVILTHGNGPQVGLLALQSSAGPKEGRYPLDVLSAQSEGLLGYLIEQELRNVLPPDRLVASLLTQVLVDPADPAFLKPTKPIGPGYPEDEAQRLATERGWNILQDGAFWRRAVPSPRPLGILEQSVIALLASQGVIVICVGGGGIPVAFGDDGQLHGVEAVIDKDRASALLAEETGADALLLLTDVDGVYLDWGKPGNAQFPSLDRMLLILPCLKLGLSAPRLKLPPTSLGTPDALQQSADWRMPYPYCLGPPAPASTVPTPGCNCMRDVAGALPRNQGLETAYAGSIATLASRNLWQEAAFIR